MSAADFGRVLIELLEMDLDKCTRTYGVSPCTAGRKHSGTAQAGAATSITLAVGASAVDDAYKNMTVRITGGTGIGQERKISGYIGATKVATVSAAWATNPNATSTYDVIDRPNACYNTYRTCQDKASYLKGTQTLKFIGRGAPLPAGELARPYIEVVDTAPVEIDIKNGLAKRANVSLKLADEPDSDIETDPYVAERASAAQGTFWTRLVARNHNTAGRFARVKRLLATPDSAGRVIYTTSDAGFVTEMYTIDSIKGPGRDGVTLTLKDPIKLADRVQIPVATDGKLASSVTSSATTLPLTAGKGVQYDKYGFPCWVLIGKEIIKIDSRSVDTLNVNASGHGQFGSVAAAQSTNAKVQLCRVWEATVLTDVLKDMLNEAGLSNTYIDTAQMTSEDTNWLGAKYHLTVCLIKPEEASRHLQELLVQANSLLWWEPVAQKVKFKVNMPATVGETVPELNDSAHLIEGSVAVEPLDAERLSLAAIYYALTSPIENDDDVANFQRGEIYIDTDAESANEYNERRSDILYSKWLGTGNNLAAMALVGRRVNYLRDTQVKIKFAIDPKDYSFRVGALADLNTRALLGFDGRNSVTRARVTRALDKGHRIECEAITTKFRNRYGFIAPSGYPDYAGASDAQRAYAFIAGSAGTMSNGDKPYLII